MVTKVEQLRQAAIDAVKPIADAIEQEIDKAASEGFMEYKCKAPSPAVRKELETRGIRFYKKGSAVVFSWERLTSPFESEISDLPWDQ